MRTKKEIISKLDESNHSTMQNAPKEDIHIMIQNRFIGVVVEMLIDIRDILVEIKNEK